VFLNRRLPCPRAGTGVGRYVRMEGRPAGRGRRSASRVAYGVAAGAPAGRGNRRSGGPVRSTRRSARSAKGCLPPIAPAADADRAHHASHDHERPRRIKLQSASRSRQSRHRLPPPTALTGTTSWHVALSCDKVAQPEPGWQREARGSEPHQPLPPGGPALTATPWNRQPLPHGPGCEGLRLGSEVVARKEVTLWRCASSTSAFFVGVAQMASRSSWCA